MKIRHIFPLIVALACGVLAVSANAQDTTGYTYFVHGAPGRDLSPAYNPVLPLDVLFDNKTCILKGWQFGDIQGPFSFPAGTYDVKVSMANSSAPCTNTPILEVPLAVFQGTSSYAVAAISPSNTLTGYLFNADLSSLTPGKARIFVANASGVPSITAGFGPAALDFIAAGTGAFAVAPRGNYTGAIYLAGTTTVLVGALSEYLGSQSATGFFVVGSATTGSLRVLRATINNVY